MNTPPSIELTSFNCPHRRVLAHQFWWRVFASEFNKGETPSVLRATDLADMLRNINNAERLSDDAKQSFQEIARRRASGVVTLDNKNDSRWAQAADNIWFSTCYHCGKVSVWVHDALLWPAQHGAPAPNPDLPDDVKADYDEAGLIVTKSPRGAAALLRLAIQKLLKHLGGSGDNLNKDIGGLVERGLDARIQQALDIVRVIGNNAVHPGQIDLLDDQSAALELFGLINLIADSMITQPAKIGKLYSRLPASAREQIENRDKERKK